MDWKYSKEHFILSLLERRLDVLLYRAGFAINLHEAKHIIGHKNVYVNEACVKHCFHILKKKDIISIKWNMRKRLRYLFLQHHNKKLKKRTLFSFNHFESNHKLRKIIILSNSLKRQEVPLIMKKKIKISKY